MSIELLKDLKFKLVILAGSFFLLPMFFADLYQAARAQSDIAMLKLNDGQQMLSGFADYLEVALSYIEQYLLTWLVISLFGAIGYLTIIASSLSYLRNDRTEQPLLVHLRAALSAFFKRGLLTSLLCFLLFIIIANLSTVLLGGVELLQFVLIFLMAYGLLIPVLLIATRLGPIQIIKQALTISIVPKIRGLKLSLFFQMLTITFLVMFSLVAISYIGDWVLNLDFYTPIQTHSWFAVVPGIGVTQAFTASSFVQSALFSFTLMFTAVFTSVFYNNVTSPQFIALIQQLIRSRSND